MNVTVRALEERDWTRVADIYLQGMLTGDATFEEKVPGWPEWSAARHTSCRIVAERERVVVGFAALTPVSGRPVYAGVAEVMVYVAEGVRGQGIGTRLLRELVECSEDAGLWTLQAGIFPENGPSIAVFRTVGFRIVGTRERLGRFGDGRWRDVVLLERRSSRVGLH